MINQVLDYLNKKPLLHIMMTEALKSGKAELKYAGNGGVLMKYSGLWFFSAENSETVDIMLKHMDGSSVCAICGITGVDAVASMYGPKIYMDCYQAVYTKKEKLPISCDADIHRLDISYLSFVREHYHHVDDEEYIRNRLESGVMYGYFVEGKIAGFIGMHDEGTMGLLEVIPEYRRHGIASKLEAYMINMILDRGAVPFCQLVVDNEQSLGLQKKMGLEIIPEHVYWIG